MTVSRVLRFAGTNPWINLAREEQWLESEGPSTLILYVNSPCIVMGKHQNPFREVDWSQVCLRGVPLLRRFSGGGTVWHDEGNLNWSLVLPKADYDRQRVANAVAGALRPLGLDLEVGDKGDLFHEQKKVSGAAYVFRRHHVLHHGTLLCGARLDDLRGVLGCTGTVSDWVGVASRPMPVKNLEIEVEPAARALIEAFGGSQSAHNGEGDERFESSVQQRVKRLQSSPWLWDQTPPFTWQGSTRQGGLRVRVEGGLIVQAWDDTNENMSRMVGKRFFDPALFDCMESREVT